MAGGLALRLRGYYILVMAETLSYGDAERNMLNGWDPCVKECPLLLLMKTENSQFLEKIVKDVQSQTILGYILNTFHVHVLCAVWKITKNAHLLILRFFFLWKVISSSYLEENQS